MDNGTPISLPAESFQFRRGAELAIQLLEQCEGDSDFNERCLITAPVNLGQPQRNIAGEYLAKAIAAGPEVLEGFTLILSDVIATLGEGLVPDSRMYRNQRAFLRRMAAIKARDQEATHG